jgi:hypothetical protein
MLSRLFTLFTLFALLAVAAPGNRPEDRLFTGKLKTDVPYIRTDKSVKYDFDIVYIRARRDGDRVHKRYYADIATPVTRESGADLMLLKPDGTEHLLVPGGEGAVTDPSVSFDGQWVYYTLIHMMKGRPTGRVTAARRKKTKSTCPTACATSGPSAEWLSARLFHTHPGERLRVQGASGVWEWRFSKPVRERTAATLKVSVKDRRGNVTAVERAFRVGG